jgi:hypothetical protein
MPERKNGQRQLNRNEKERSVMRDEGIFGELKQSIPVKTAIYLFAINKKYHIVY